MFGHILAFAIGFLADFLLGDPLGAFHIVIAMGKLISAAEKAARRLFPKTEKGELIGGLFTVILVCTVFYAVSLTLCRLAWNVHFACGLIIESFLCWQCLAARCLCQASMSVYNAKDIASARKAVAGIVGRDTENLDHAAVSRACIETVAENCSDGVIAPMLFMAIGGAPLGVLYKAINTMDSMLGYKNERYLFFGRAAAQLDDIANFIPARIAGVVMAFSAVFVGQDAKNAFRIFKRDRLNHSSPNSAHTEAACAGALHIRLGGPSVYFGKVVPKPYIGDDDRAVEPDDIPKTNRLMMACAIVCFVIFLIVKGGIALC